ncbi:hypothetical protein ACFE04_024411 [Oxalis oulophora]
MAINHHPSLTISFFFVAVLLCLQQVTARNICDICDYKQLCRGAVRGATTAYVASQKSMEALRAQIVKRKVVIAMAGHNKYTNQCIESYDNAMDMLKQSMDALKTRDTGSLMSYLSATLSSFTNCDDAYAQDNKKSPFAVSNLVLIDMASNSLALSSLIH